MKKLIISCFFILCSLTGWAQYEQQPKGITSFGIKAGWIQSDLYGKELHQLAVDGKTDAQNSFFAGIAVSSEIGKYFALRHELFYQQYGAQFARELDDDAVVDAKLTMRGLKINPISPTFKIGGLEIYAGPYIHVLLNASITAVDENGNTYQDYEIFGTAAEDTEDYKYLQKMDYGFVAGIDYVFKKKFSIGAYYSRGFAPIFDNANSFGLEGNPGVENIKIYNESFGVSLGFLF
ncbi:outer membrane beta-barrel protein [Flavobacterium sp. JP2137]|uniref:outer membrane beta-barrel protein n=1 Tax=Flavobacterium sp. JP2137 TaxID=3414510 RepID=UPI003D2FBB96